MSAVVADTHALVWLLFAPQHLSPNALNALQGAVQAGEPIYVAAISLVEITYLVEKGVCRKPCCFG
jgi:PIN domain nuclease of toxin-antitoxin system